MELAARIRSQHGVCSLAQALEGGLTEDGPWRVASKPLAPVRPRGLPGPDGELDWLGPGPRGGAARARGLCLEPASAEYLHGVAPTATPGHHRGGSGGAVGDPAPGYTLPSPRRSSRWCVARDCRSPRPSRPCSTWPTPPGVEWREAVATRPAGCRSVAPPRSRSRRRSKARARHRHRPDPEVALGVVAEGAESVMEVSYVQRVERAARAAAGRRCRCGTASSGVTSSTRAGSSSWRSTVGSGTRGVRGEGPDRDREPPGGRVTLRAGWVDVEGAPCELAVDVHAALRARGYAGRSACAVRDALPGGPLLPEARASVGGTGVMAPVSPGSGQLFGEGLSEGGARTGSWPSRPFSTSPSPSCAPTT